MKRCRLLVLLSCLSVLFSLLAGCVSQDAEYIRRDINTLQRQIDDLQREIRSSRTYGTSESPGDLEARKGQADFETEFDNLRMSLNTLSARMDDNQQLTTTVSGRIDALESNLLTRLDSLEARVDQLTGTGEQALAPQPGTATREAKTLLPTEEEPSTPAEIQPGKPASDMEKAYNEAYQAFKADDLDEAKDKFGSFLRQYPDTPLSDNAQFWIGEISFKKRQYEAAILAYEDVIKKYPNSNKRPDAILKQGLAFMELGDRIDARIVLENLVKDYPNTEQAKIAEEKLKTLR